MPGGLLNIVSEGQANIILNGNPQKTFFNSTYKTYSNFGMQKFRIDFDGQRTLRMSESSTFRFYVPRYAELLMDTYMVIDLPTIWSPYFHHKIVEYGGHTTSSGLRTWDSDDRKCRVERRWTSIAENEWTIPLQSS